MEEKWYVCGEMVCVLGVRVQLGTVPLIYILACRILGSMGWGAPGHQWPCQQLYRRSQVLRHCSRLRHACDQWQLLCVVWVG
jgi:hypothetical protein